MASEILDFGVTVAALVAVNSLGSVIDPRDGRPWESRLEMSEEFGEIGKRSVRLPDTPRPHSASNTTIGVIATDAILTKAQAQKVAQMAQDGLAMLYDLRTPCSTETPSSASPPTRWFCPILPVFSPHPRPRP